MNTFSCSGSFSDSLLVDLVGEVLRLVGSHLVVEGDPGGDDEAIRPHVHGAQLQQRVHAGLGLDFLTYQLLHLRIGRAADEQFPAVHAELDRHDHEQHADGDGRRAVPDR